MRIVFRVITVFLVLLMVLISGFVLLCALGIISETHFGALTYSFYDNLGTRAIVALACVFIILISVLILLFRPKSRISKSAKILTSRNGAIKIAHRALSEMISGLVKENKNVSNARVRLKNSEAGLNVLVIAVLNSDNGLVETTKEIETDVAEMLTERCGVKVDEVEVLVDRVLYKPLG